MIYLLYGPDTYRSRAKVREIITAFNDKAGTRSAMGFSRVDAAEDPEAIFTVGRTASLFSEKELVVIERACEASSAAAEHIRRQLPRWAHDRNVTVVFWEDALPRAAKSSLAAEIAAHAEKSQEFKPLAAAAAERWLDQEVARRGLELSAGERRLLLASLGSDLWALSNELEKVRHGWPLRRVGQQETAVWDFTDAFLRGRRSAYVPLVRLLDAGFDAVQLLASLGGALRTSALVWSGVAQDRLKSLTARLNPFVVRKHMEIVRNMDGGGLTRRYEELLRADTELKTGRLPAPLPLVKFVLTRGYSGKRTGGHT